MGFNLYDIWASHAWTACEEQKKETDLLGKEGLWAAMWMMGTEFLSSRKQKVFLTT